MTEYSVFKSEVRDGMRIDWDLGIEMDDGLVLRADIFRPEREGRYPVLITCGPYAKGLSFQKGYPSAWQRMADEHPDVMAGSTNKYQNWEVSDPEKWVPHGYVCVRVDSRGCGRSPGFIDHFSPRETKDFYNCVEWAGVQTWSNGKVGINGVSYYAVNQWQVAALRPPHLAAICPWEGATDFYRDMTHHGGIRSTFFANWYDMQVKTVQHGRAEGGGRSELTGQLICGDEVLDDETMAQNRADFGGNIASHPLLDEFHKERSGVLENIEVPFLSSGNWGGSGLHLRGNVEGFLRASSKSKWLEIHGIEHWTEFYTDYGVDLQRRFFDHFLKGAQNGWDREDPVLLQIRHLDRFEKRAEREWPIARTQWTKLFLTPSGQLDGNEPSASGQIGFDALGEGVTFIGAPLEEQTEVTGPLALKLWISSTTTDADIFAIVRVLSPNLQEVVFQGAIDPHTPVAQGWLRASHRRLDEKLSMPYRPFHSHTLEEPLTAGKPVELDIEIWPTCIVVPAGYRLALTVRGKDYEYPGPSGGKLSNFKNELRGCGPFLHDDPHNRPPETYGGTTSIHFSQGMAPTLLVPVIPPKQNHA